MTDVKIYRVFIASPSDTQKERKICDKVFEKINKNLGDVFNFRLAPCVRIVVASINFINKQGAVSNQ